jgi:hypothetical protein
LRKSAKLSVGNSALRAQQIAADANMFVLMLNFVIVPGRLFVDRQNSGINRKAENSCSGVRCKKAASLKLTAACGRAASPDRESPVRI